MIITENINNVYKTWQENSEITKQHCGLTFISKYL